MMTNKTFPAGFQVFHADSLLQELVHDAYHFRANWPKSAVCPQCNAVLQDGRWRWGTVAGYADHAICPACQRQHDRYPAGFVTLEGPFFNANSAEIMELVHEHERHERTLHPLKRIMAEEHGKDSVLLTTTDIFLARAIGEALHRAYQGELKLHYKLEDNRIQVHWIC